MHRAEPECSLWAHAPIIQTVGRKVWLNVGQMHELVRLRIESMQPGLESHDEAAAAQRREKSRLLRRRPEAVLAARPDASGARAAT